jgi:hypothetical protein
MSTVTSPRTPCLRHPRETWIAGCPDCTTWHLTALHVAHRRPDADPHAAAAGRTGTA